MHVFQFLIFGVKFKSILGAFISFCDKWFDNNLWLQNVRNSWKQKL